MEGTHRKRIKHYHEPGDFHELTFSCQARMPLLTDDDWLARLSKHTDRACKSSMFDLVAFVYMPEHVHLLVYPRVPWREVKTFLAELKRPFSAEINELLIATQNPLLARLTVRERPGKECFRFWLEGAGYDRNIRSNKALQASIDYIHMNPVRRGLCEKTIDWPWSSARYYLLDPPKQQFPDLPFVHGIPLGSFD